MHFLIYFLLFFFVGCGGNSVDTEKIAKPKPKENNWYKPDINTSWHWQLTGDINMSHNVDLYDIDLFDTNKSVIKSLQNSGKKVICYFSAGSIENWRDDATDFPIEAIGKEMDGWAGEKWLDIRSSKLREVMTNRLDIAVSKGCDGVEPDNVDGYSNDSGFVLTSLDQLSYNKFLSDEAHKRGLSIGLKNDLDQVKELEPYFDFALNEQCHEYSECSLLKPFVDADKPVFNAEYNRVKKDDICMNSLFFGMHILILPMDLDDSFRVECP
jgi:hypothetical protein